MGARFRGITAQTFTTLNCVYLRIWLEFFPLVSPECLYYLFGPVGASDLTQFRHNLKKNKHQQLILYSSWQVAQAMDQRYKNLEFDSHYQQLILYSLWQVTRAMDPRCKDLVFPSSSANNSLQFMASD